MGLDGNGGGFCEPWDEAAGTGEGLKTGVFGRWDTERPGVGKGRLAFGVSELSMNPKDICFPVFGVERK